MGDEGGGERGGGLGSTGLEEAVTGGGREACQWVSLCA